MKNHFKSLFTLTIIISCLILSKSLYADNGSNDNRREKIDVAKWLKTVAIPLQYPSFHEHPNTRDNVYDDNNLLQFEQINFDGHFPSEGSFFSMHEGEEIIWEKVSSDEEGMVTLDGSFDEPSITYISTYIWADRWLRASLEIGSPYMLKAWLNGEVIGEKTKIDEGEDIGSITKSLKLERGKHLLMIKTLMPAGYDRAWTISSSLKLSEPFKASDINITTDPVNRKNISHILDGLKVSGVSLSPDGSYYTISYRRSLPPGDDSERWTEIRRRDDNHLVHSYRHAGVSRLSWLPNSNKVSYVAVNKGKSTIYLHDFEKGEITELLKDVEKFSGYRWAPNEEFMIYIVRDEAEKQDNVMRRVAGMADRQPGWRNRSFLYRYDIVSGKKTQLTWGNLSTSLHDICPYSKRILFSQSYPDYDERPFRKQNLFVMDLNSFKLDTILFEEKWSVRARFSPDGKTLLATGGPSAFNGAGENVPEDVMPHNSDTQAYIYNLDDRSVKAITYDFNPSVESLFWHKTDNNIYMLVTDKDYRRLYRYDLRRERFTKIETGTDFITSLSFANNALIALYGGNLINRYPQFYSINLRNSRISLLSDIDSEGYRNVEFGETKDWNFTSSAGIEIKGRVYYPPGFDAERSYPVIVYYYGGIRPVGRTFGGRYPFNLWAGNDYLVYVLQPSGAVGFGQEFSAAHINNWGTTVVDEIIEGTEKFLKAHPYANTEKVGCAGASYGGFMTMLLLTRTDIFTTAVSHAGISSISSYWGEGYWGYAYSAEASAKSYPWNNKELYVGQSPLFYADKINTPLLLLTGDDDTNVPPGESIQMYTALKLLGKPVELVLVKGENHHILTYSKRKEWHNAIMAWWDRYLKEQDEWWFEQFPEKNY